MAMHLTLAVFWVGAFSNNNPPVLYLEDCENYLVGIGNMYYAAR